MHCFSIGHEEPLVCSYDALFLLQLANARSEQERLEAEARRARDAAHNQQLELMRHTISASKVTFSFPLLTC